MSTIILVALLATCAGYIAGASSMWFALSMLKSWRQYTQEFADEIKKVYGRQP